jgi:phage head maturation protease
LKRKNVRGASFSFDVDKEGEIITIDEKDNWHREITKATLYEIGPVTNPAYESTEVSLRSVENIVKEIKQRNAPKTDNAAEIRANREKEFFLIDKNII